MIIMENSTLFLTAYRELERRMERQAEQDGHVFVPNPEPATSSYVWNRP